MTWIACSQRHHRDEHGNYRDVLECSYTEYFSERDIVLVPVSNALDRPEKVFEVAGDGLLLTGGDEVDPGLYGGERRDEYVVSEDRDATEHRLLEKALERNMPVLAVCRGLQTVNVYFGGGLEDLNADEVTHPPDVDHDVTLKDEGLVQELGGETATVNSYHDQAVSLETVASDLEPFAVHGDRVVEGLYHPNHSLAGVQWHPERDDEKPIDRLLVESFRESSWYWG